MAFDGLLSQIANPQMADIAGAIDFREKRLQEEQKRQKDAKMKELMGQAIPHLREGSVLQEMAKEDPERFMLFTKAVGIPIDQAGQLDQMSKDVRQISKIMATDPEGAISYADSLAAEREKMGLDTTKIRGWVDLARADSGKAGRAMTMLDQTLNSDLIAAEKDAQRKADLAERGMKVQEGQLAQSEKQMSMGGGQRQFAGQVVNTSEGLAVFDPSTNTFKRASLDGKPLTGASYDPNLKRDLSQAGAEGAATGKDIIDYKGKLFDSINSGARTLNKYNFAIEQIDKGAESGPVMKLLPNLREQTILVDVIRKEIGMEILGSGALGVNPTDKDVTLAMDSAIPESLSPKALKTELQRRAKVLQDLNTAQEKYYDLIEQGYTKGDILKMAKEQRATKEAPKSNAPAQETAAQRFARLKADAN